MYCIMALVNISILKVGWVLVIMEGALTRMSLRVRTRVSAPSPLLKIKSRYAPRFAYAGEYDTIEFHHIMPLHNTIR